MLRASKSMNQTLDYLITRRMNEKLNVCKKNIRVVKHRSIKIMCSIYIYAKKKKSTNYEPIVPYTTSTQWMESWNSIENASRIMLRPWLQKRINHFYRDRGRENNNHREGIYHERKRIAITIEQSIQHLFSSRFKASKNLF